MEIFKVDTTENIGINWLIAEFGFEQSDNKKYILTTDGVHASELYHYSLGAKEDCELVARLLNDYYGAVLDD